MKVTLEWELLRDVYKSEIWSNGVIGLFLRGSMRWPYYIGGIPKDLNFEMANIVSKE